MLNILINAYAVSPNWGSEPGLGWNWIANLSKYCNLFVITEGEWKDEIEAAISKLPHKDNLHMYYNPVIPEIRCMCWNQGDWRFYKYYRQWQKKSFSIAKQIIKDNHIDIIHQLNMIGFREPGNLWKIKDIPFVWGPVGGYGWTTLKYLRNQPIGIKAKAVLKNILNVIQAKFYPLSNQAMKRADRVIAANSKVFHYIRRHFRDDVILMNETGCYEISKPIIRSSNTNDFRILWVGKFDYRKQLELAIRTIAILRASHPNIILNIVGDKDNENYKRLACLSSDLSVDQNIKWHGKIPNASVHKMMQESDIFLFTSIDEGTPHVVLEAIQNNLPVVCFDTCGQGDVVNESVGIKIPLTNSRQSQLDFAKAISFLIENRDHLNHLRLNCRQRQSEMSWENKIEQVISIYNQIVESKV